jgi:hypothetical protein
MNPSLHRPSDQSGHDAAIQDAPAFAHEVRVELHDSQAIVGSIIFATECPHLPGLKGIVP